MRGGNWLLLMVVVFPMVGRAEPPAVIPVHLEPNQLCKAFTDFGMKLHGDWSKGEGMIDFSCFGEKEEATQERSPIEGVGSQIGVSLMGDAAVGPVHEVEITSAAYVSSQRKLVATRFRSAVDMLFEKTSLEKPAQLDKAIDAKRSIPEKKTAWGSYHLQFTPAAGTTVENFTFYATIKP